MSFLKHTNLRDFHFFLVTSNHANFHKNLIFSKWNAFVYSFLTSLQDGFFRKTSFMWIKYAKNSLSETFLCLIAASLRRNNFSSETKILLLPLLLLSLLLLLTDFIWFSFYLISFWIQCACVNICQTKPTYLCILHCVNQNLCFLIARCHSCCTLLLITTSFLCKKTVFLAQSFLFLDIWNFSF